VAPTVALALVGLIAVGGIAFDYARMVGMHSELQNAADQAALAAATQLDGRPDAMARATTAANDLVSNLTRLSNDGEGGAVGVASVSFYSDLSKTPATSDANARFAEVLVDGRQVFYALTPIVNLMSSGLIDAQAMAGMGSATCKVPPVMICNPAEETGDFEFTTSNYIGKGLKLVAKGGGNAYAPGNFGFLDNNGGGAIDLARALGNVTVPGDCSPQTGVTTEPGSMVSVMDALNTRFDIYANGLNNPCEADGSGCPPSANTRKDVLLDSNGPNQCSFVPGVGGKGWKLAANRYLPTAPTPYDASSWPSGGIAPMGYPRDLCHAVSSDGECGEAGGRVGTGDWDRYAYFRSNSSNYPTMPSAGDMTAMFGSATPTRYQVYRYEMENAATRLQQITSGGMVAHSQPVCLPPGIKPEGANPDRRRISVAVINCKDQNVNGKSFNVAVQRWIDVFLVEPSLNRPDRTDQGDIYVEVIGDAGIGGDGTAGQVVRRDVPYLVE
jgi:hypothetical protein